MKMIIAYLPGDGIGPDVGDAACHVLTALCRRFGHSVDIAEHLIGGAALDAAGTPLPEETLAACREAHAILLGAVGRPGWDTGARRPETGRLTLRRELDIFIGLRPVTPHPRAATALPVRAEILNGAEILVVRELTDSIHLDETPYTNEKAGGPRSYSRGEIERVVRKAAQFARNRRGRLTLVDRADVPETSRLWRNVISGVMARDFPDVELELLPMNSAARHLISRPRDFDVVVTDNVLGGVLADEASVLAGSVGLLPSASLGEEGPGIFEPVHGPASEIAGKGVANPFGMVLSVAMMLRHAFHLDAEAETLEEAVWNCLDLGLCTPDMGGRLSTVQAAEAVADALHRPFLRTVAAI